MYRSSDLKKPASTIIRHNLLGMTKTPGACQAEMERQEGEKLRRIARLLCQYTLQCSGTLDRAIRNSNAQFEEPDIIERLDVRLLEQVVVLILCHLLWQLISLHPASDPHPTHRQMHGVDGGSGWEVFSLDYHVDMPISLIFTPEVNIPC